LYYRCPRRRREKRAENLFQEIIAENFPNLAKETDVQMQEAQQTLIRINKAGQHQNILQLNLQNIVIKKKNLESSKKKEVLNLKGKPIRPAGDFSTET